MNRMKEEAIKEAEIVLVIDDETDILNCIVSILESRGYKTVAMTSPHQALDFLKSYPTKSSGKDGLCAVISDLNMPQMDGLSFFRSMCALGYSHLPFILMSGRIQTSDFQTFANQGVDGLLCKPFSSDSMTYEIEEARLRKFRKILKTS